MLKREKLLHFSSKSDNKSIHHHKKEHESEKDGGCVCVVFL